MKVAHCLFKQFSQQIIRLSFIILLLCFITIDAKAQCQEQQATNTSGLTPATEIGCNASPQTVTLQSTYQFGGQPPNPVTVIFNGGIPIVTNVPNIGVTTIGTDNPGAIGGCLASFMPVITVQFSRPVHGLRLFSNSPGLPAVDNSGNTTLPFPEGLSYTYEFTSSNITSVTFTSPLATCFNTFPDITYGCWDFSISLTAIFIPNDSITPIAGTVAANPSSASGGATVNITGFNWTATPSGAYKLLFDGNLVAQQSPLSSCSDQPNLSFDVPCGAAIGNHTLTIQLTDSSTQVLATQQTPFSVTSPPFAGLALTTCQNTPKVTFQFADGSALPNPLRIGLTTKITSRKVVLRAVILPAGAVEAKDIDIVLSVVKSKVLKISPPKIAGDVITFEVDGVFDTIASISTAIQAKHKTMGVLGEAPFRVVIPHQVDPEHDTVGRNGIESANLAQNITTSPAEPQASEKEAMLVTYYERFLEIKLLDQYGDSLGDLYNNSKVEESTDEKSFVSLNQPIQSGSFFFDPVGFTIPPFDKSLLVKIDSKEAVEWPTQPKIPLPDGMGESRQNFALRIDGDDKLMIPISRAVMNRLIQVKIVGGVASITVVWP